MNTNTVTLTTKDIQDADKYTTVFLSIGRKLKTQEAMTAIETFLLRDFLIIQRRSKRSEK